MTVFSLLIIVSVIVKFHVFAAIFGDAGAAGACYASKVGLDGGTGPAREVLIFTVDVAARGVSHAACRLVAARIARGTRARPRRHSVAIIAFSE